MVNTPFVNSCVKCHLRIADQHCQRTEHMVESTNAVLQQDELHDVADLLKVYLSDQHVDGVGGGEDDGEEEEADDVTSHWDSALAARGGEATTPENSFVLLWVVFRSL